MHREMFAFVHARDDHEDAADASGFPRDDDDDDDGFVAFVEGPQLLLFRSFIASCDFTIISPSKRTEKCRESHERGTPKESKKKM